MYKEEKIKQKFFLLADQLELMQFNSIQKEKEIIFVNEMIKQKDLSFIFF